MKILRKWINKLLIPKENIISFREAMNLTEMPIITLYQGDKKFNFLLDTGSNDNVISKSVIEDIEHEKIKDEYASVVGMEGRVRHIDICMISLSYKDKEYRYKYIINDLEEVFKRIKKTTGVTLHGMIGSKFFNEYKYILDFDSLTAYSKL